MFFCCIALLIVTQGSVTDTLWTENTEHYTISVQYPDIALENEAVGERLEEYASGRIGAFKDNCEECFQDDPLMMEWNLEIYFTHEPSPDSLICILAWMWSYTGGAHGNTWTQAFVFDQVTDSIM